MLVCAVTLLDAIDQQPILQKESHQVLVPEDYNKTIRPANGTVYLGLRFSKIHSLNPGANTFRATGWLRRYWLDTRLSLRGDPSHATGIVNPSEIWTPDIAMEEQVDDFQESCSTPHAIVFSADLAQRDDMAYNVFYSQQCIFTVSCTLELADFPFDTNVCAMTWIPWIDYSYHLAPAPNTSNHKLDTQLYRVEISDPSQPHMCYPLPPQDTWSFVGVRYNLTFSRYSRYYVVNFIMPLCLNVILSWFTFFIPLGEGHGDRLAYPVTLLLTALAVLFVTSDKRPPEKKDGWIDEFQISSLLLTSYPIMETIWLQRIIAADPEGGKKKAKRLDRVTSVIWPCLMMLWFAYMFNPWKPMWKPHRPHWDGHTIHFFCFLWYAICLFVGACASFNLCMRVWKQDGCRCGNMWEAMHEAMHTGLVDSDTSESESDGHNSSDRDNSSDGAKMTKEGNAAVNAPHSAFSFKSEYGR